jgi:hypothetical protein
MMRTGRRRPVGLLDQYIHAAVLRCSHHEVAVLLSARPQKGVQIAVAISHVNPLLALCGLTNGLDTALPHLRLALPELTLPFAFSFGRCLTQKGFLMGDAEHLPTERIDGQHRLQQEAVGAAIADGT